MCTSRRESSGPRRGTRRSRVRVGGHSEEAARWPTPPMAHSPRSGHPRAARVRRAHESSGLGRGPVAPMLTPRALLVPTLPTLLVDEHRRHRTPMLVALEDQAGRLQAEAPEIVVALSAGWESEGPFL